MDKIAILGSGASGLLAAWVCLEFGKDFDIFSSDMNKPKISGFVYLHNNCNIPFIRNASMWQIFLPYHISDSILEKMYSNKVYRDKNTLSSILQQKNQKWLVNIWNMQDVVDVIWEAVKSKIKLRIIHNIAEINDIADSNNYKCVISTIPLNKIDDSQEYEYTTSYIQTYPSDYNINFCIYDAAQNIDWYRMGSIFGSGFKEYAGKVDDAKPLIKVITAKKLPKVSDNVLLTGRYGKWDKSVLIDKVYGDVKEFLEGK